MPIFSYLAVNDQGAEQRGTVEAGDAREAAQILRTQSLYLLEISDGGTSGRRRGGSVSISRIGRGLRSWKAYLLPVTMMHRVFLFRQLSLMLHSGYTVVQALDVCADIVERAALGRSIKRMTEEIRRGAPFSAALRGERRYFSPFVAELVASGEASGELETVLERIANNLERSIETKRQLITALIYPSFILLVSMGVAVYMFVDFIPKVSTLFDQRRAALPWYTQLFIDISNWIIDYGPYLVGGTITSIVLVLALYTIRPGKAVIDRILLSFPLVGKSIVTASMAQFGATMETLLRSGLTVLESLRILVRVTPNSTLGRSYDEAADRILRGRNLAAGLDQKHIPFLVQHMATIGERSGELEKVMGDMGNYYSRALDARVKMIVAIVPPIGILIVAGIVAFIYISMVLTALRAQLGGLVG